MLQCSVPKGDLHCQCILSIFPPSVHQFYVNILVFGNINPFLYINDQFALVNWLPFYQSKCQEAMIPCQRPNQMPPTLVNKKATCSNILSDVKLKVWPLPYDWSHGALGQNIWINLIFRVLNRFISDSGPSIQHKLDSCGGESSYRELILLIEASTIIRQN